MLDDAAEECSAVVVSVRLQQDSPLIDVDGKESEVAYQGETYPVHYVFGGGTDSEVVHDKMIANVVNDVMQGVSGIVLVCGQPHSGKSYTVLGTPDDRGIVPRAIEHVFLTVLDTAATTLWSVKAAFVEIVGDTAYDLSAGKLVEVKTEKGLFADVKERPALNDDDALEVIDVGLEHRHPEINGTSVFRLVVKREWIDAESGVHKQHSATLDFIDIGSSGTDHAALCTCAARAEAGDAGLAEAVDATLLTRSVLHPLFLDGGKKCYVCVCLTPAEEGNSLKQCLDLAKNAGSIVNYITREVEEEPASDRLKEEFAQMLQVQQRTVVPSALTDEESETMPGGWQENVTEDGRVYYIDHNSQTTTWIDPRKTLRPKAQKGPTGKRNFFLAESDRDWKHEPLRPDVLPEVAIIVTDSLQSNVIVRSDNISSPPSDCLVVRDAPLAGSPQLPPAAMQGLHPSLATPGMLSPGFAPCTDRRGGGAQEDEADAEINSLMREYQSVLDSADTWAQNYAALKVSHAEALEQLDAAQARAAELEAAAAAPSAAAPTNEHAAALSLLEEEKAALLREVASLKAAASDAKAAAAGAAAEPSGDGPAFDALRAENNALKAEIGRVSEQRRLDQERAAEDLEALRTEGAEQLRQADKEKDLVEARLTDFTERSHREAQQMQAEIDRVLERTQRDTAALEAEMREKAEEAASAEKRAAQLHTHLADAQEAITQLKAATDRHTARERELTARCDKLSEGLLVNKASTVKLNEIKAAFAASMERDIAEGDPAESVVVLMRREQENAAKQQELKESLTVEQELRERTEQRLADIQAGHDKNVLQLKEAYTQNHKDILQWFCTKQHNMIKQQHAEYTKEVKQHKARAEELQKEILHHQYQHQQQQQQQQHQQEHPRAQAPASSRGFADRDNKRSIGGPDSGPRRTAAGGTAPRAARSRSVGDTGAQPRVVPRQTVNPSASPSMPVRSLSSEGRTVRRSRSPGDAYPQHAHTQRRGVSTHGSSAPLGSAPPPAGGAASTSTPFSSRGTPTSTRYASTRGGGDNAGTPGAGRATAAPSASAGFSHSQVNYDLDRWRQELSLLEGRTKSNPAPYSAVPPYSL